MILAREPILNAIPIAKLRPTQITVGMREVEEKRARWRKLPEKKKEKFLGRHMIPVVLGPKKHNYIIDHHHLVRALYEEGVKDLFVTIVANLSGLDRKTFWVVLDHRSWVHAYDADGQRRDFKDLPKSVSGLEDDPFRSLAGALRRAGGFAKETTPFSEFLWVEFLRRHLRKKLVENDFKAALRKALVLAKSPKAKALPGWCGRTDNDP